jgi:hypothetical protein
MHARTAAGHRKRAAVNAANAANAANEDPRRIVRAALRLVYGVNVVGRLGPGH